MSQIGQLETLGSETKIPRKQSSTEAARTPAVGVLWLDVTSSAPILSDGSALVGNRAASVFLRTRW